MKLILGTMTFSDQVNEEVAKQMVGAFHQQGHHEIDTARIYNNGKTEQMLGHLVARGCFEKTSIATKLHPWNDQGLQPEKIQAQFNASLGALGVDSFDLLYLHSPDLHTPIRQTLQTCWEFYQQKKFRRLGLSNYAAWQVAEIAEICRHEGWIMPSVYQGLYNALNRDIESELLPCLRNYGIQFYAYNPLAGGLLTGKHRTFDVEPETGRFTKIDGYKSRYWKEDYFAALNNFVSVCEQHQISPTAAALSWLVNHSDMQHDSGDGIILGASKLEHLQENMQQCKQSPLPDKVVEVLNQGWQSVKANCFRYFRC